MTASSVSNTSQREDIPRTQQDGYLDPNDQLPPMGWMAAWDGKLGCIRREPVLGQRWRPK